MTEYFDQPEIVAIDLFEMKRSTHMASRKELREQLRQRRSLGPTTSAESNCSFDRLSFVCPSLALNVRRRSSQNRSLLIKALYYDDDSDPNDPNELKFADLFEAIPHFISTAPFLESVQIEYFNTKKYDYVGISTPFSNNVGWIRFPLVFEQQLRSLRMSSTNCSLIGNINKQLQQSHRFSALFGPKLRNLNITQPIDNYVSDAAILLDLFHVYASQLISLQLNYFLLERLKESLNSFPEMTRLKTLTVFHLLENDISIFMKYISPKIPWHQLESFKFVCASRSLIHFLTQQLFDLFKRMTELRKFSLIIPTYLCDVRTHLITEHVLNFQRVISEKSGQLCKLEKLQVFQIDVNIQQSAVWNLLSSSVLDYDYYLRLFFPALSSSLKKLTINVSNTVLFTQNIIFLDFNEAFAQLETLVLDYKRNGSLSKYKHFIYKLIGYYDREDVHNQCSTLRHLTLAHLPVINHIVLNNISVLFPNLVELNIGLKSGDAYAKLGEHDMETFVGRLKHLRVLRFIDDHPKVHHLHGSIVLLCERAIHNKPRPAMMIRIPIDHNLSAQLSEDPKLQELERLWTEVAKWIQIF